MRRSWAAGLAATACLLAACSSSAGSDTEARGAGGAGAAGSNEAADAAGTPAGTVTLAFAGDVHFEGALAAVVGRDGATLGPMSAALREADVGMVNLESAVTRRGTPAAKELEVAGNRYWFRTGPRALDVLAHSGVDVATVANNHGADHGLVGLRDTVRAGSSGAVTLVGAGLDVDGAFAPYRTTVRGTDVTILAADASPLESRDPVWSATRGSGPGLATARGEAPRLVAEVEAAAAAGGVVAVYLHWGEEGEACPTDAQRTLARRLADAGADVVVGSHAHVPQGAGLLDQTYVSYGLGNFFWYHGNQSETGVLQLQVGPDGVVDDTWVPAEIRPRGGNPQPLTGAAGDRAVASWQRLRSCTDLEPGPAEAAADDAAADGLPAYASAVRRIGPALRAKMVTYDPATCPVPLSDLRHLTMSYVGFDGEAHRGVMVVAAEVAADVRSLFGELYAARFPLQRMRLVDAYGGDDDRSMAANNTSGFNCRTVAGTTGFSSHAYGRAVDVNPVQNPYVVGGDVRPPAAAPYVDRAAVADQPGVVTRDSVVARAFARIGWRWGGDFSEPDYQHFDLP